MTANQVSEKMHGHLGDGKKQAHAVMVQEEYQAKTHALQLNLKKHV